MTRPAHVPTDARPASEIRWRAQAVGRAGAMLAGRNGSQGRQPGLSSHHFRSFR